MRHTTAGQLQLLMPRYVLDDAAMASLIAYLKSLYQDPVPGVSDTTLQFATIVTPDADPVERKAHAHVLSGSSPRRMPPLVSSIRACTATTRSMYMVNRHWQLHVWELTGPARDLGRPAAARLERSPVSAVLSGLAGATGLRCTNSASDAIPCLFPNVEVPVVAERTSTRCTSRGACCWRPA